MGDGACINRKRGAKPAEKSDSIWLLAWWRQRRRTPPPSHCYAPPHVSQLVVPWMSFDGLLDTAFEQIRHYAVADVTVSLRFMRAYNDIAKTTPHADLRASLLERPAGLQPDAPGTFRKTREQRVAAIEGILAIDDSQAAGRLLQPTKNATNATAVPARPLHVHFWSRGQTAPADDIRSPYPLYRRSGCSRQPSKRRCRVWR
jgi:hypothetical protein